MVTRRLCPNVWQSCTVAAGETLPQFLQQVTITITITVTSSITTVLLLLQLYYITITTYTSA